MPLRDLDVASALSLSVVGTTCCALPIALVAVGAGSAVASLVSAVPWLVALSAYKGVTFSVTAIVLGFAWWRTGRLGRDAEACDVDDARRLRWQRRLLRVSTALLFLSVFAAYALDPLTRAFAAG